jgi:uncharacterized damage-inducible protein DinB
MSTLEMVRALYAYHEWADDRLLDAAGNVTEEDLAKEAGIPFGNVQDNLLHILGSQVSWLMRLTGKTPPIAKVEPGRVVPALKESFAGAHGALAEYLSTLSVERVEAPVKFVEFDGGQPHNLERPLWEVLLSVGSHGLSHRSEVGLVLTSLGASPEQMDYSEFAWRHALR